MIIVREVFIAKPGNASKFAKMMKESFRDEKGVRIMTDLTGVFNKVVMETEMKDLAEFEARMRDYRENPKWREKMGNYTEMYKEGKREIYQVQ